MKQLLRVLVVVATAVAALAVTGSALAAFNSPRLIIQNPSERVSGGGALTITYRQVREDDAPFRIVIYIPQGYTTSLVQQPGTQVGTVAATAQGNAISADTILPLTGTIVAQEFTPAAYPNGAACVGNAAIDSVWELRLTAAGQNLVVPAYVVAITEGPETAFASGKLVFCLPSPYIPPAQGGAAFGAKLLTADMRLRNIFSNPASAGDYRWRALVTPWTVGTATPNPAGTIETQAIDKLPAQLTANLRVVNRRLRIVNISGTLRERSTRITGAPVQLMRGAKILRTVKTNRRGAYSVTVRLARGLHVLRTRTTVPVRQLGTAGCVRTALFGGVPCTNASLSGYRLISNVPLRIRFR